MPKSKVSRRKLMDIEDVTATPPDSLSDTQSIAQIRKATGNNLYMVKISEGAELLVELQQKFRSSVWLRRNGFVLIDREPSKGRENKIQGEIVNIVRNEKAWKKMAYWPDEFSTPALGGDSDHSETESEDGL